MCIEKVTADIFYKTWIDFFNMNKACLLKAWNNSKQYTELTIGEKYSSKEDSPFGNFFKNKFKGYEYRQEDGLVDISFYKKENYHNIFNLYEPKSPKFNSITLDDYPIYYDILIEHENEITMCYEEMIKLTAFRSDLKVLITYNWEEITSDNYKYVNETIVDNFKKIISQSNQRNSESREIEYLLIIGQLNKEQNNVNWYQTSINGDFKIE